MQYRLIHLQTDTDYFSHYELGFLTLLDTYAPCTAECINLYPNTAYVLLYGKAIPDDAALSAFCVKLSADITKLHGASVSFLIGVETDGLTHLPDAAASMETLRERMLGWETPVILADELLLPELGDFSDIERQRAQVDAAIATQDEAEILTQTKKLSMS